MFNQNNSRTIKAGSITYFFDIKETRQNRPYLVITMSRFRGEEEDRDRVSMPIFPEHTAAFVKIITEMAQSISGEGGFETDIEYPPRPQISTPQLPLRGMHPRSSRGRTATGRR